MSPINTMFIFIIICFTMSAVSCSHELRDVCTVEGDTLHCRWTGAGLYNTRIRLDVKKVVFERFFVAGQLDLANNRDLHSIEIKQGNSKCSNVLAAPETITIVNGIHCDNGVIASTTTTAATRVTPGSTLSIGTTDKQLKSTPHAQEEDKGLDNIKIILIMIFASLACVMLLPLMLFCICKKKRTAKTNFRQHQFSFNVDADSLSEIEIADFVNTPKKTV
ncbi:uncharacterized protein LOC134695483 isoform X1 [Mytilus trossulus]|uniref:uncharacterized protein LOC134695483 isoform X1 n=1 Tax=Mytilus trossulus TaxID=6551 RepID=UPI003003B3C3